MTAIRDYLRQIAGYLTFISVSRKSCCQKKNMVHIFAWFLNLLLVLLFVSPTFIHFS